jgi:hypothetical protein
VNTLRLALRQVHYENRAFWRNPQALTLGVDSFLGAGQSASRICLTTAGARATNPGAAHV